VLRRLSARASRPKAVSTSRSTKAQIAARTRRTPGIPDARYFLRCDCSGGGW
jgi:hypothetical protein